jgi:hypothetical protein
VLVFVFGAARGRTQQAHAPYCFAQIADNSGPIISFRGTPVISNTGVVAFRALLDDGRDAIVAVQNGSLIRVADSSTFPEFNVPEFNSPGVSGNGIVVFSVREAGSGPGLAVFAWVRGALREVVRRSDLSFTDLAASSINEEGLVPFWGRTADGDLIAVRSMFGGPIRIIAGRGQGLVRVEDGAPDINRLRQVAFLGSEAGSAAFFVGTANRLDKFVDTAGPFQAFSGGPSLNDFGQLTFHALLDAGAGGVFEATRKGVRSVVQAGANGFSDVFRPDNNNRGDVAFMGRIGNGRTGIFVGPDSVADKLIAAGDTLDGLPVNGVDFWRGLNDQGQVVFVAFSGDVQRLYRADPCW